MDSIIHVCTCTYYPWTYHVKVTLYINLPEEHSPAPLGPLVLSEACHPSPETPCSTQTPSRLTSHWSAMPYWSLRSNWSVVLTCTVVRPVEYSSPSNINPTTEVSRKYTDILADRNAERIGRWEDRMKNTELENMRIEHWNMPSALSITIFVLQWSRYQLLPIPRPNQSDRSFSPVMIIIMTH